MNFQSGAQAKHDRRAANQSHLGASDDCRANGAHCENGGDRQADFRAKPQEPQPHGANEIIDFVDYL